MNIDEYLDLCMADANIAAGDPEFLRVYDARFKGKKGWSGRWSKEQRRSGFHDPRTHRSANAKSAMEDDYYNRPRGLAVRNPDALPAPEPDALPALPSPEPIDALPAPKYYLPSPRTRGKLHVSGPHPRRYANKYQVRYKGTRR